MYTYTRSKDGLCTEKWRHPNPESTTEKELVPIYHRKCQLEEANSYHDNTAVLLAQLSEE
jgi:hypothetical protein